MAKKYTIKELKEAIKGSKGIISVVARRLNCAWHTALKHIKDNDLQLLINDENEINLDYTESKLFENIKEGKEASIFFHLKTKGKHRGYQENSKIEHSGEINFSALFQNDPYEKDESES